VIEEKNPFKKISELFLNNQNNFNNELHALRTSLRSLHGVIQSVLENLETNPFETDLSKLKGMDTYTLQIISQAKDLENSTEKILESIRILEKANEKKLNS